MPLLLQLLVLPPCPLVSIVGAGGKTTTMYTLADELAERGQRVVTTTTTNIYHPQPGETDTLIISPDIAQILTQLAVAWKEHRRITVSARSIDPGKLAGLQLEQPYELLTQGGADAVVVEADGARHRLLKAPAAYEPVVPPQTNVALLLLSAAALQQPLTSEIVHRPERVAAVVGMEPGDTLTPERVARLLASADGGLKQIPLSARAYVLVTHATPELRGAVAELATFLSAEPRISAVLCSPRPGLWAIAE